MAVDSLLSPSKGGQDTHTFMMCHSAVCRMHQRQRGVAGYWSVSSAHLTGLLVCSPLRHWVRHSTGRGESESSTTSNASGSLCSSACALAYAGCMVK